MNDHLGPLFVEAVSVLYGALRTAENPSAVFHKDGIDYVNLGVIKHDLKRSWKKFDYLQTKLIEMGLDD